MSYPVHPALVLLKDGAFGGSDIRSGFSPLLCVKWSYREAFGFVLLEVTVGFVTLNLSFPPSQSKCSGPLLRPGLKMFLKLHQQKADLRTKWEDFLLSSFTHMRDRMEYVSVATGRTGNFHLQRDRDDDGMISQWDKASPFGFPLLLLEFRATFWLILVGTDHFFCKTRK